MPKNNNKLHRYKVYLRSNFKCVYCKRQFKTPQDWDKKSAIHDGQMFLEIDHVKPLAKGGSDKITNKQALCQKCNNRKSDKFKTN